MPGLAVCLEWSSGTGGWRWRRWCTPSVGSTIAISSGSALIIPHRRTLTRITHPPPTPTHTPLAPTQSLAAEVASYLGTELGKIKIKRFADGEIYVQVGESIRGADVFLVQPTSPPVNDHFMELAVMIDACRRASARSITAVIP